MIYAVAIVAMLADWIVGIFRWLTAEYGGDAASHGRPYR